MSGVNGSAFLLLILGLLAFAVTAYAIVVLTLRIRKKPDKATSKVDFVVDTFHGLVSQLKEKERELEVLRKQAEERAGIIEDYNENILQSVPSGVVSMDDRWNVVKVNSSAERILGVRASDVIGRDGRDVFPGEFLRDIRQRGESQFVTASGKALWLGFTLTPLLDGKGNTIGQLLVFTDLTGLKALESQAELRKRLSSLGEMAAGIAHELRNPMAVISGYMRLLSQRVDESLKQTVDSVSGEVSVMDRIINNFLSFTSPGKLKPSEINISSLIRDCIDNLRDTLQDVNVSVNTGGVQLVLADEVLMRQAFTNLINNAREAIDERGTITIACAQKENGVEITVSDTGHGMAEGIRDKIFLPFYTTKEKGTGLGLAIVHRIITDHGGTIDCECGKNDTVFRILLPLLKRD